MLPVILVLIVAVIGIGFIGDAFTNIKNGGSIEYNERAFQDYANAHYAAEFENSSEYEGNLLLFFLTNEENDGYYALAWVGDDIRDEINVMFGDETTVFGTTVLATINAELYTYSLDSNLASVAGKMAQKIKAKGFDSSFKPTSGITEVTGVESHLTNKTALPLTEKTVNDALVSFTEETGIPIVIVVDEAEAAFGVTPPTADIVIVIVFFALIALAVFLIVRAIKNKKNGGNGGGGDDPYDNYNRNQNGRSSGYNGGGNYGGY